MPSGALVDRVPFVGIGQSFAELPQCRFDSHAARQRFMFWRGVEDPGPQIFGFFGVFLDPKDLNLLIFFFRKSIESPARYMAQTWDIFLENLRQYQSPGFSGFKNQAWGIGLGGAKSFTFLNTYLFWERRQPWRNIFWF